MGRNVVIAMWLSSCTCGSALTPEAFPAEAAKAICTKMYGCCTAEEVKGNDLYGPDEPSCEVNVKKGLDQAKQIENGQKNGRLAYHPDRASECLSQYEALSCDQLKSNATTVTPSCDSYLEPKAADGTACGFDGECVGGACVGEGIGVDGTCHAFLGENAGCTDGGTCGKSLYCDLGAQACKPLKADGAPCNGNFECATGGCNGRVDGGAGTCGLKGGAGTMCFATNGCSAAPGGVLAGLGLLLALSRRRGGGRSAC